MFISIIHRKMDTKRCSKVHSLVKMTFQRTYDVWVRFGKIILVENVPAISCLYIHRKKKLDYSWTLVPRPPLKKALVSASGKSGWSVSYLKLLVSVIMQNLYDLRTICPFGAEQLRYSFLAHHIKIWRQSINR